MLTDGFLKDVGITQDQFNTGNSLLFLGIILLEIPSNYCLQIIGPRIWISFQVLAFGLVATLQAFQSGYGSYLATRILLGVTECGYIPGERRVQTHLQTDNVHLPPSIEKGTRANAGTTLFRI